MKKAIAATNQTFESSCSKTPEYMAWHRLFKRELTKFLVSNRATEISIANPNHFDMSGFFTMPGGQMWYFSISDIRWSKDCMLLRTAQSYSDFTGGRNQFIPLASEREFVEYCNIAIRLT